MPAMLLHILSTIGHYMSFGPLIALIVYLVLYHGLHETTSDRWI